MPSYEVLSDGALSAALESLQGWSVSGGTLTKEFKFPNYSQCALFTGAVAHLADRMNHHPDLLLTYGMVRVSLVTHDAGGITSYDTELAKQIEALR